MIYLILTSLIWAFSFGLVKGQLTSLEPNFVACSRLLIALPVFLPFLRLKGLSAKTCLRLIGIGAIQYGLTYTFYLIAMQKLNAYEAALFTIFTPLYVSLINDLFQKQFSGFHLGMSLLAVLGAAIIKYSNTNLGNIITGFVLMQISNICFSFGQIAYKRIRSEHKSLKDSQIYALLFLGGVLITAFSTTFMNGWSSALEMNRDQILTLVFLGAVASGIGFFWWNKGAVITNAGTLAVMNNLKIPLAVAVSLLVFGERVDIPRLLLGGSIMILAIVLNEWHKPFERKS